LTDFRVDREVNGIRVARLYISDVFRAGKRVFLTVVSEPLETKVYLDGVLAQKLSSQYFQSSKETCSGNFVVGDSPSDAESWQGELYGLAIYRRNLSSEQVMASYNSWTKAEEPDESMTAKPDSLYLFKEKGDSIHDRGSSGVNLSIPKHYEIAQQTLLESPWRAFRPTSSYLKDILINIGGFVPFGLTLGAFLVARGRVNTVTSMVVLAGFLLSLTIETLQSYLPTRDSDLTDVMTNTLGTWIGAILYWRTSVIFRDPRR
jgi:VanZ family protein